MNATAEFHAQRQQPYPRALSGETGFPFPVKGLRHEITALVDAVTS